MDANVFLRKLRAAGLYTFLGNAFAQSAWSLFSAFDLFTLLGVDAIKSPLFGILAVIMVFGCVFMFLGTLLQRKVKKPKIDASELGDHATFYEHQKGYAEPEAAGSGGKSKATFRFFGVVFSIFAVNAVLFVLYEGTSGNWAGALEILANGLYRYSIALWALMVAFLVALVVGNVNEDMWRLYIAGYHVHESVIGLYFTCIGAPMIANGFFGAEFWIGMAFIVSGIFLVGRDWKDVVKGDILVHKSREPDYDKFVKLKSKQDRIFRDGTS